MQQVLQADPGYRPKKPMLNGLAGHEYAASVNVWILGGAWTGSGLLVLAKGWMEAPLFLVGKTCGKPPKTSIEIPFL